MNFLAFWDMIVFEKIAHQIKYLEIFLSSNVQRVIWRRYSIH